MQEPVGIEKKTGTYQPSRQKTSIMDEFMRINMSRFVRNRNTIEPEDEEPLEDFPLSDPQDKQSFADACYDTLLGGAKAFEKDVVDEFIHLTVGTAYTSSVVTAIRSVPKGRTKIKMRPKEILECSEVASFFLSHMSDLFAQVSTKNMVKGTREINIGEGLWDGVAYALSERRACHFFTVYPEFMPLWVKMRLENAKLKLDIKNRKRRSEVLAFINTHADIKSALEDIIRELIISSRDAQEVKSSSTTSVAVNRLSVFERYVWRNVKWKSEQAAKTPEQPLPVDKETGEAYELDGKQLTLHKGMRYDNDNDEKDEQFGLCRRLLQATVPVVSPVVSLAGEVARWWRKMVVKNQASFSFHVIERYLLYADLFEIYANLLQSNISHTLHMRFCEKAGHNIVFSDPDKKHSKIEFRASNKREATFVTPRLLDLVSNEEIMAAGQARADIRKEVLSHAVLFEYSSEYKTPTEWVAKRYRFGEKDLSSNKINAIIIGGKKALRMLRAAVASSLEEHCRLRGKNVGRQHLPKDMMKHRVVSALPEILRIVENDRDTYDFEVCRAFFSFIGIASGLANPVGEDIVLKPTDSLSDRSQKIQKLKQDKASGIIRDNGVRWKYTEKSRDGKPVYKPLLHRMGSSVASVETKNGIDLTNTEIYYLIVRGETPDPLRESLEDCGRYIDHNTGAYRKEYELSKNGMWWKHRKPVHSRQATRHVKLT